MLHNLSPRERMLILLLGPILILALGFQFGWRPLQAKRAGLETEIAAYQQVIAQLSQGVAMPAPVTAPAAPLSARITQSADAAGLQLRRLEPEQEQFRVTLEDENFASVILWLADMEETHAITAAFVEMDRQAEPGIVSVRLLLGDLS